MFSPFFPKACGAIVMVLCPSYVCLFVHKLLVHTFSSQKLMDDF